MQEWLIKYWLEALFGGVATVLVCVTKYLYGMLKKEHKEQEDMKDGILALLKNSLIKSYNEYMEKGWVPIYALDAIEAMYEAYHSLGGNGTVTNLMFQLRKLPNKVP